MAYKVFVTQAAHEDLEETLDYIAGNLSNPAAAVKLLDEVEACYDQLRQYPYLYESCRDRRLRNLGYHKVTVGNYLLVYHPDEKTQTVNILRFFYGGRDYEKLI